MTAVRMKAAAACAPHGRSTEDLLVELAILGVLAERTEIYPSHLVGELRRRAPMLPAARIRPVLELLWQERRVARLWHRYLLPDRIPAVRARWLATIDRLRSDAGPHASDADGFANGRAILTAWDGWRVGAGAASRAERPSRRPMRGTGRSAHG